ncbi:YeiH family protein [Metallumcola ferriviriculae]|uniref:YeiH family protein n=1 Tax=Metallumcola ferriviriculae TaxID=3039180 RepID=A0AAU0UK54_9FIRM|nr:YeiH family protein [Desulfitibacteraceae bacterium MK1]
MSVKQSVIISQPQSLFMRFFEKIPGILLLLAVGYAAKIIAGYIPHMDYVLIAILLGMIISNAVTIPQVFVPGINTYELWLKTGIVFLGARLLLQHVAQLGGTGFLLVLIEISVSIATVKLLERIFKIPDKMGSLIAIGVGICGVSAIIGATGAIEADEEDASYAIATILIFGAVAVFLYPLLGHLMGLSDTVFGFWAGLAVDNTAEAVATGFAFSDQAGQFATIAKLTRNALMGVVILAFALVYARKGMTGQVENKGQFIWSRFPKFLLGFLAFSLLGTVGFFSSDNITSLKHLSSWAFMLSFAGIGFRTEFARMRVSGFKPVIVGFGAMLAVSVVTLVMVYLVYA